MTIEEMSTTREQILARFTQWWDESDDISNDGPWEPDSMIQFAWAGYNAAIQQYKDSLLKMGKIIEKRTIERCAVVCDESAHEWRGANSRQVELAAAIRALGDADEN